MKDLIEWLMCLSAWAIFIVCILALSGCASMQPYSQTDYMMNALELCNGNVAKFDPNTGRFVCKI